MIDRQHGLIIFECDNCADTLETGEREFPDAMAVFRREGWKAQRSGSAYVHACRACRSDGGFKEDFPDGR